MIPFGGTFHLWFEYSERGVLPYPGSYLQQPLELLVQFAAIDMVAGTYRFTSQKEYDASKLSLLQNELRRWLKLM